jgi:hypothetical protein
MEAASQLLMQLYGYPNQYNEFVSKQEEEVRRLSMSDHRLRTCSIDQNKEKRFAEFLYRSINSNDVDMFLLLPPGYFRRMYEMLVSMKRSFPKAFWKSLSSDYLVSAGYQGMLSGYFHHINDIVMPKGKEILSYNLEVGEKLVARMQKIAPDDPVFHSFREGHAQKRESLRELARRGFQYRDAQHLGFCEGYKIAYMRNLLPQHVQFLVYEFNSKDPRLWDHHDDEPVMLPIIASAKMHKDAMFSMDETLGILGKYGLELAYRLIPPLSFLDDTHPERVVGQMIILAARPAEELAFLSRIQEMSLGHYYKVLERELAESRQNN